MNGYVEKVEGLAARSRRAKEALDAVPPLLDQLRQSILAAAFRGDLTADWRAKRKTLETADDLLTRIRTERRQKWEESEFTKISAKGKTATRDALQLRYKEPEPADQTAMPDLPRGWRWATLEEVGLIESGQTPNGLAQNGSSEARDVPWFRVGDMNHKENALFMRIAEVWLSRDDVRRFGLHVRPAGTIVFPKRGGAIGTNKKRRLIRASAYDLNTMGFIPVDSLANYIWAWFQTVDLGSLDTGTSVPQINHGDIAPLTIPVPPQDEAEHIGGLVERHLGVLREIATNVASTKIDFEDLKDSILARAFRGELVPQDPNDEPASVLLERIRAARNSAGPSEATSPQRSRRADTTAYAPNDDDGEDAPPAPQPEPARGAAKDLSEVEQETLRDEIFAALWTLEPLEKDDAVRRVAEHLRQRGYVDFQRLRADGPLYSQILEAIESAVKEGRLDRPKRGHVRACKADAAAYTADDWRQALVASLGAEPVDRDEAIRAAAEWARDNLGLEFARLRGDGHIVEGLRSAINSAVRRGEVTRHGTSRIARAATNAETEPRPESIPIAARTPAAPPDRSARPAPGGDTG